MSDPVEFRVQLDVSGKSEAHVTEFAIAHLRERGYYVAEPNENWETPKEFNKRLGISGEQIHRALDRAACPNVLLERGRVGRINRICSNPAFEAFVLQNKNRPKSTWKRSSRMKPAHLLERARMHGPQRDFTDL